MTAKKSDKRRIGVLDDEIRKLMTPEAVKELNGLTPTIQQFLLRWQDHRDIILGDQLKEELKIFLQDIYEKDNESLCKSVAEIIVKEVGETIAPIWNKLENLERGQKEISDTLTRINKRLDDVIHTSEEHDILIKKLIRQQRWWNIGLRILLGVAVSAIITLAMIKFHEKKPVQTAHPQQIEKTR